MGGKVNLKNIPTKIYCGRTCCDWENSVGAAVPFCYNGIEGVLQIIGAHRISKDYSLTVKYCGAEHRLRASHLRDGHIGSCVGGRTPEHKLYAGQQIKDKKRNITILNVYKTGIKYDKYLHKVADYRCNNCGEIQYSVREEVIVRGGGCPVCDGKTVKKGFNDIPTTAPWMVDFFPGGIEQAERYTESSGRQVRFKCTHCGRIADHDMAVATLNRTGSVGCPCGDGISTPEKFLFNLMTELKAKYKRQVSSRDFPWCGKFRYDGMLSANDELYFIEIHGIQHYEEMPKRGKNHMTLAQVQANDRAKQELALVNGIKFENYIVLDCRKSELSYMKNSICASRLAQIFDMHKIDWQKIFAESLAPLQKKILDWALSNPTAATKDIAEKFGVNSGYPAAVLNACGIYGKKERSMRRSRKIYEDKRAEIFAEIQKMMNDDPDMTLADAAEKMNRTRAGLYALLRKYKSVIDVAKLHDNAENYRKSKARTAVQKSVRVTAPDGEAYEFESLTDACEKLQIKYNVSLPKSSVSVSIKNKKKYKGFSFGYK